MKQSRLLPHTNEEHEAVSSFNEKTQAVFPPLFKSILPIRAPSSGVHFWERPARSTLFIQFLSFALSDIRNADNSRHHVIPPKYRTSFPRNLFPSPGKILTCSLLTASHHSLLQNWSSQLCCARTV